MDIPSEIVSIEPLQFRMKVNEQKKVAKRSFYYGSRPARRGERANMIKSDNERLFSGFMSDKLLRVATFLPSSCHNLNLLNAKCSETSSRFFRGQNVSSIRRASTSFAPTSTQPVRTISNGKHNNYDLPRHIDDVFLRFESLINHTKTLAINLSLCAVGYRDPNKNLIVTDQGDDFSPH